MKFKLLLLSLITLSILSNAEAQSQANCDNIYLDTDTFYLSLPADTIVSGNLIYLDTVFSVYPFLEITLTDTSIITSKDFMVLSSLDSGFIQFFNFSMHFKTNIFPNNTVVNGIFHIYDSDIPGDSIVTCYMPITIILENPNGIHENGIQSEHVFIYPNPADKNLTLEFNNVENINFSFTLFNLQGQPIQIINNVRSEKMEINIEGLKSGMYYYTLNTIDRTIATGKVVIE